MVFALQAAMLVSPVLKLGGMRFSAFGVCAILGLMAAFTLMRWTATMAGAAREPLIDAGFFGVLAGLVISRLLLILQAPVEFIHYPLLVLSLPSFTLLGGGLTAIALFGYLRWKKLPLLQVLDAWAPCAALLTAGLSIGYFIEGAHPGMPTTLPWGILDPALGRIHPVQMYEAVAAIWLCVILLALLARPHVPGSVARWALIVGGLTSFLLDDLRQPDPGAAHALLEPGQWVALGVFAVGFLSIPFDSILARALHPLPTPTREEVAFLLENLVAGRGRPYDHEIIEYGSFSDPLLLELKKKMPDLHEGPHHGLMTQEEANRLMLDYAGRLRTEEKKVPEETP